MTLLGITLLWLLYQLLPVSALARLGEALGGMLCYLARTRRYVVETNLRLCFPALTDRERVALLKGHFRSAGRAALLEAYSWWAPREAIENLVRVEGIEHFDAHHGQPMILLAPHFIGLNIGGVRVASLLTKGGVSLYARIKNPLLDRLMLRARTRFNDQLLVSRSDGIKPILRALKQGRGFYYLPDLDYGRRESIFVPFFNVPAATISGLPRIAKATGAAVVPAVTRWQGDHYVLRFYPAWTDFPSGDIEADTRRMNAFIEERVREMPEQYFWLHRRFKTRPTKGEPRFYA